MLRSEAIMSPQRGRSLLPALLFAAVWGPGLPVAAQSQMWSPNDDDALILELRDAKGAMVARQSVRGYQVPQGVCLDLGDMIRELELGLRFDPQLRRAAGWFFGKDQQLAIDRAANMVKTPTGAVAIRSGDIYDTPSGWCVNVTALSQWTGLGLKPDLLRQEVVITSDSKSPYIAALERKQRNSKLLANAKMRSSQVDLAQLPRVNLPYKAWRNPALDIQVQTAWSDRQALRTQSEVAVAGELLGLSYSGRVAGRGLFDPSSARLKLFREDPDGTLLGPLRATEFSFGDVQLPSNNLSARGAFGRGAYLTNRPRQMPWQFGKTTLRGALPAGWDAELYVNQSLRAFQNDRGDGRYEFTDVTLQYGVNDFEVVLYGPQGEVRRERFSQRLGADSLPAGRTEYWLGLLDSGKDLLGSAYGSHQAPDWRWGFGVQQGLNSRTTAGVSYHSQLRNRMRQHFLEGLVRRSAGPMLVELSGAKQVGAGELVRLQTIGRVRGINILGDALWTFGRFDSDLISLQRQGEFSLRLSGLVKIGSTRVSLDAGAHETRLRTGGQLTEFSVRSSFPVGRSNLALELLNRHASGPDAAQLTSDLRNQLNLISFSQFRRFRIRGNAALALDGKHPGLQRAQLIAEMPSGRRDLLQFEIEHSPLYKTQSFRLGYAQQFQKFAIRTDGRINSRGNISASLTFMLSLGQDPVRGGWRASGERLAATGQLDVLVFRDDNGDGLQQQDEPPIPGVRVNAGPYSKRSLTDKSGHTLIDGLNPFSLTRVAVDTSSIPDPLLQPKGTGVAVTPRPGVTGSIAFPLAPTGEIEAVLLNPQGRVLGGVEVELVDEQGHTFGRERSDADGYLWFGNVPYGTYRMRLVQTDAVTPGAGAGFGPLLRIDAAKPVIRVGQVQTSPAPANQDRSSFP